MSFAVARTFSILGHPLVVLPVGVLLPMLRHAEPVDALMTSAGFIGFAAAVMLWSRRKVKHGAWEHVDASRLDERRSLNRFLLPLILAGAALAWVLSSPPRVVVALSAAAGIVLAAMLVSRWCKLSLHVAFAVFAAGLLWPLGAAYSAVAAAFAVAIAWSRLKLSRHAPRDLIAGALAGALAIAACQLLAPLAGAEMGASTDIDEPLRLFHTADHACGYWPERQARDLVFDPGDPRLAKNYPMALQWGFRRSGNLIYRPHCRACQACIAVRVPVDAFAPNRSQRRCLQRNIDLDARVLPAERNDEHFALYQRYLSARHPAGGMDGHGEAEFDQFLVSTWAASRFLEIREHRDHGRGPLLAVAVTDVIDDGLSAVYTFYDPDAVDRGLGVFAILQQIAWARREGKRHLYLGYWIDGHAKMAYKRRYQPLESFDGQRWRPMPAPAQK